jgi:hypothetical protein
MTMQAENHRKGPELHCASLPAFDTSNLAVVQRAFGAAAPVALAQAWQPAPSPNFAPAEVRVGMRQGALFVFAELADRDIHTAATGLNQRMWELGDVLEIFLRPAGQEVYFEFHVTPNNQRLQLRIPNTAALRRAQAANVFDDFLLPGQVFRSTVWLQPDKQKWFVLAEIPGRVICGGETPVTTSCWHFSFSRYDYTRGATEPVISSTSPHGKADFHRQEEWGVIRFAP